MPGGEQPTSCSTASMALKDHQKCELNELSLALADDNRARYIRKCDRANNEYPRLDCPNIFTLAGGYKGFHDQFKDRCEPQGYVSELEAHKEMRQKKNGRSGFQSRFADLGSTKRRLVFQRQGSRENITRDTETGDGKLSDNSAPGVSPSGHYLITHTSTMS
jgi:hypothetical protein